MRHLVIYVYDLHVLAPVRMRFVSGLCVMAAYVDILKSEFPLIDCEVFDYITGTVQLHLTCAKASHYSSLCAVLM